MAVIPLVASGYEGAKLGLGLDFNLAELVLIVASIDCLRIVFHRPSQLEWVEAYHSTHETIVYLGLETVFALSLRGLGVTGRISMVMAQRTFRRCSSMGSSVFHFSFLLELSARLGHAPIL